MNGTKHEEQKHLRPSKMQTINKIFNNDLMMVIK